MAFLFFGLLLYANKASGCYDTYYFSWKSVTYFETTFFFSCNIWSNFLSTWFDPFRILVVFLLQKSDLFPSLRDSTLLKAAELEELLATTSLLTLSIILAWGPSSKPRRPAIAARYRYMNLWRSSSCIILAWDSLRSRLWRRLERWQYDRRQTFKQLYDSILRLVATRLWTSFIICRLLKACTLFFLSS